MLEACAFLLPRRPVSDTPRGDVECAVPQGIGHAAYDEVAFAHTLRGQLLAQYTSRQRPWRAPRQQSISGQQHAGRIGPASARRANRSETSRFIRRIANGVIAENQGKTRNAGFLRVALFPSKHSRVRIPSPALTAKDKTLRSPMGGRRALQVTHWKHVSTASTHNIPQNDLTPVSFKMLLQTEHCMRTTRFVPGLPGGLLGGLRAPRDSRDDVQLAAAKLPNPFEPTAELTAAHPMSMS